MGDCVEWLPAAWLTDAWLQHLVGIPKCQSTAAIGLAVHVETMLCGRSTSGQLVQRSPVQGRAPKFKPWRRTAAAALPGRFEQHVLRVLGAGTWSVAVMERGDFLSRMEQLPLPVKRSAAAQGFVESKQRACPELDCCSSVVCGFVMCSFVMWQPPAHLEARERLLCKRRQVRLARRQQLPGWVGVQLLIRRLLRAHGCGGEAERRRRAFRCKRAHGARCKRAECPPRRSRSSRIRA